MTRKRIDTKEQTSARVPCDCAIGSHLSMADRGRCVELRILRSENKRLNAALRQMIAPVRCSVCHGHGTVSGFWLGTFKTCPACHGRGRRPR